MGLLPPTPPPPWVVVSKKSRHVVYECRYGHDAAKPGALVVLRPDESLAVIAASSVGKTRVMLGTSSAQACDYCRRIFAEAATQCPSCGAPRRMVR